MSSLAQPSAPAQRLPKPWPSPAVVGSSSSLICRWAALLGELQRLELRSGGRGHGLCLQRECSLSLLSQGLRSFQILPLAPAGLHSPGSVAEGEGRFTMVWEQRRQGRGDFRLLSHCTIYPAQLAPDLHVHIRAPTGHTHEHAEKRTHPRGQGQ